MQFCFFFLKKKNEFKICRFTEGMMIKLNNIRNKANSVHILHLIETTGKNDLVIRFPFDKIMIEKKLFNKNELTAPMVKQMKRFELQINRVGH